MCWNTIFLLGCLLIVLGSCYDDEYILTKLKISGELRKACSKRGNAYQPAARVNTTLNLINLRELMRNNIAMRGVPIDAYIITSSDEHQSEFVSEYDRRREFISGFSGSYGDVIVTENKSVLWTDGRYHLQADDQLDCNWLLMREGHKNIPTKSEWLQKEFPNGAVVGADPRLISQSVWQELKYEFSASGSNLYLVEVENNLIDLIWTENRPPKRNKDMFILDEQYSGKNWTAKVAEVRKEIRKLGADGIVVTALDEIAWLLNIRGRDIPFTPFVRSYVILDMYEIRFFVNRTQLLKHDVFSYFNSSFHRNVKDKVRILDYEDVCSHLQRLSQAYRQVLIPSACVFSEGASRFIYQCVPEKKRMPRQSPIIFLKAKKNPVEIQGMKNAHIRDAAAMCEFFAYFENKVKSGHVFTELEVVKILNEFRFEQKNSLGNSFRTIAGFGSNGAHPHYEPTPNTNAKIYDNSTLVLDSGGQYYDGTTDVTRTLHLGTPTEDQKQAYTRVLIGQIQLSTLTFPANMRTSVADVMARAPLWEVGLDYMHMTSHGIGSFLGVHESPIGIGYNDEPQLPRNQLLKPGYFLSNEPGFYREGDFGIRLENVMLVLEKPWLRHSGGHPFLGFKVVTLVPYEQKLMDLSLLSVHHRRWLNAYNEKIRNLVGAELKRQNLMSGFYWMMDKTNNIPEYGGCNFLVAQSLLFLIVNAIFVIIVTS